MSWDGSWGMWPRYTSVAERRRNAERAAKRLERDGKQLHPVATQGRTVAKTFWGKAWCDNLLSYSDYENRLPRGLSYLRNGAVLDLGVREGIVDALVSGTDVYRVKLKIRPLDHAPWSAIKRQCAGQIGSLVDLLRGKLSSRVMEIIARPGDGLFPAPKAMTMTCSCPDWAVMCKHVAAVLYGIGARLDEQPELLFLLRKVDHLELIAEAPTAVEGTGGGKGARMNGVDAAGLGAVFGIELSEETDASVPAPQTPGTSGTTRAAPRSRGAQKTHTKRKAGKTARTAKTKRSAAKAERRPVTRKTGRSSSKTATTTATRRAAKSPTTEGQPLKRRTATSGEAKSAPTTPTRKAGSSAVAKRRTAKSVSARGGQR